MTGKHSDLVKYPGSFRIQHSSGNISVDSTEGEVVIYLPVIKPKNSSDYITVTKLNPKGFPITFLSSECKINDKLDIKIVGLNQKAAVVKLSTNGKGWKLDLI